MISRCLFVVMEMDGFTSTTNVIVLAGFNCSDVGDPSLACPREVDLQIYIDPLDNKISASIFKVYLSTL